MWSTFFLCVGACILLLYLPGFLFMKGLRFSGISALCCAPIPSMAAYGTLPVLYGIFGIPANLPTVLIPTIILFMLVAAVSMLASRRTDTVRCNFFISRDVPWKDRLKDWGILVFYALVGICVCGFVFVKSLDGPASFYEGYDNVHHLNLVRAFLDTGIWSSLSAQTTLDLTGAGELSAQSGFYPAAWHAVVCLVHPLSQDSIPLTVNAVNAAFSGIVFPVSMFLFVWNLFPQNRSIALLGAFTCMAFTAFPWGLMFKGPSFPNVAAIAVLPAMLGGYLLLFRQPKIIKPTSLLILTAFSIQVLLATAFTHPGTLFAIYAFAIPFLASFLVRRHSKPQSAKSAARSKFIIYAAVYGIGALLWVLMGKLPFFQAVMHHVTAMDVISYPFDALAEALSFAFMFSLPQFMLVGCVCVGVLYCFIRKKAWLVVPALFMLIGYVACRAFSNSLVFAITGFWYNDPWRLAAYAAVFLAPLAAAGLFLASRAAAALCARALGINAEGCEGTRLLASCMGLLVLLFCFVNYYPNYSIKNTEVRTAFGYAKERLATEYDLGRPRVFSEEEKEFVSEALSLIPSDAIVINHPNDGSMFAYATDGLNAYFRRTASAGLNTDINSLLRGDLKEIASNPAVKEALARTGATYVLLLDQGIPYEDGTWFGSLTEEQQQQWAGIETITDDTPGFEIVLAKDDMRLYKIDQSA